MDSVFFMELIGRKILFLFLFLLVVGGLVYYFFSSEEDVTSLPIDTGQRVTVGERLGVDTIQEVSPQQIPFDRRSPDGTPLVEDDLLPVPSPNDFVSPDSVLGPRPLPRLFRLFPGPTAGYRIDQGVDDSWRVRVVEQGRGNRYVIETEPYSINLVSAGEFTKVLESYVFSDGTTLVMFESDTDETVIRSAFTPFVPTPVTSGVQRFEDNIRVATNNENLLFFTQNVDGESVGLVVDVTDPENTKMVWESSFSSWLPRWGRNSHITVSTPMSQFARGYVYLVDPDGEDPVNRFVHFSSGGSAFIDTSSGFFVLHEIDRADFTGETSISDQSRETDIAMPVTLPEKCDGFNGIFVCAVPTVIPAQTISGYETRFPDSWYQGDISFEDSIVLVDANTGERRLLLSPDQPDFQVLSGGAVFDVVQPRISEDGRFLFFLNKYDLSLWVLRIS